MEFHIQSQRWGCCLFSFNVFPEILDYHLLPGGDGQTCWQSLLEGLRPSDKPLYYYNLFGIHDLISIFQRVPDEPIVREQHSVVEKLAEWSLKLAALKSDGGGCDRLAAATDRIWSEHLPKVCTAGQMRELRKHPWSSRPKVPSLYNYTYDVLVPLYPAKIEDGLNAHLPPQAGEVLAFCFLRVDPRVMRVCNQKSPGKPDCLFAYSEVFGRMQNYQSSIIAVWAGLGMSQLIVMLRSGSFSTLADIVRSFRDETKISIGSEGFRPEPYTVVSSSSTLITIPTRSSTFVGDHKAPTVSVPTKDVGFYILVRLLSGYHGNEIWSALEAIASITGLGKPNIRIGDRQGLFDLVIQIRPGTPCHKVLRFIEVVECGCHFVADIATIIWDTRTGQREMRINE